MMILFQSRHRRAEIYVERLAVQHERWDGFHTSSFCFCDATFC